MNRKITAIKILAVIAAVLLLFICLLSITGSHLMVYMPGDIIYASPEHDGGLVADKVTFRIEPDSKK